MADLGITVGRGSGQVVVAAARTPDRVTAHAQPPVGRVIGVHARPRRPLSRGRLVWDRRGGQDLPGGGHVPTPPVRLHTVGPPLPSVRACRSAPHAPDPSRSPPVPRRAASAKPPGGGTRRAAPACCGNRPVPSGFPRLRPATTTGGGSSRSRLGGCAGGPPGRVGPAPTARGWPRSPVRSPPPRDRSCARGQRWPCAGETGRLFDSGVGRVHSCAFMHTCVAVFVNSREPHSDQTASSERRQVPT